MERMVYMLGNIYMSFDDIIRTYNLYLTATRGEVKFYRDTVTNKEYQFVNGEFIKVKDGSIAYKFLKQINGYKIKYNTNGLYGFTIFRGYTIRRWNLEFKSGY